MSALRAVDTPIDTTPIVANSRLTPEDIAEARRLAHEAPPFTPEQAIALRALLGPAMRRAARGERRAAA